MMKKLVEKPFLIGILVSVLLFIVCLFIRIPMYDGIFYYDNALVHFQLESKIALSYFMGIGLDKASVNGVPPTHFEFKPIGYVLFALIHIGLPALIIIRFKLSNARNAYAKASEKEQKLENFSND
ncbi:hypothetical protein [Fluviicola taffensis]|uniref:Uncharacterized protein n=1 Tax=Fluviicola taffensis (strain DSM 16823 / NCIMB 13979 / RW262) TaxID=755732 RepID=F2IDD1_FLUTR|nr:hypothetical protein [Fluviicola taffensis]AEA42307.1 hypothetical protein Fluta_0298 [Fluviicola taffensis DSM 16823]